MIRWISVFVSIVLFGCNVEHYTATQQWIDGGAADETLDVVGPLVIDYTALVLLDDGIQSYSVEIEVPAGARFNGATIGEGAQVTFSDPSGSDWLASIYLDDGIHDPVQMAYLDAMYPGPIPAAWTGTPPYSVPFLGPDLPIDGWIFRLEVQILNFDDPPVGANGTTQGHVEASLFPVTP